MHGFSCLGWFFFLVVGLKKVLLQHFFCGSLHCCLVTRRQDLIKKKILTHLNLLKVGAQSQRANEEKAQKKEEGIS